MFPYVVTETNIVPLVSLDLIIYWIPDLGTPNTCIR